MLFWTKLENRQFDLLKELVKTRFKLRYNNSVLGFVWVLMKPFLNFLILYFIFTAFRGGVHDSTYAANLFSGLIIFYFFQEGVVYGMNSLVDMAGIILKINFPRQIALTSSLLMAVINFIINFFVIIIITLWSGFIPEIVGFLYFSYIIFIIFGLIYGISLFMSIIFVKVRDLTNIMDLFFQLLFWASGIFYNLDEMGGNTGAIIRLNPIAIMIDAARKAFIHGQITQVPTILLISIITVIMIIFGHKFFNKNIRKIAEFF
jgi:ABC-type polysaccharide/polyol phosphate export permease